MKNCVPEANVASMLPDYARNAHGNLAEQNRLVGQQHGANTAVPENKSAPVGAAAAAPAAKPAAKVADPALALLGKHNCTACHAQNTIKAGGSGVWGPIPMPAQSAPEADIKTIANWLAAGAAK
jgi:cytochrome c